MSNLAKRRSENVELTSVSITGEPKKLKAHITYEQQLTVGQYIGIGVSSVAAAGLGYYFGRLAGKGKDSKIVRALDKLFGIDYEVKELYDDDNFEEDGVIDVEVDEEK